MNKFDDTKNIKTYNDSNIIKRLYSYLKPVKWYFVLALFLTCVIVVADLIPAYLEGKIIGALGDSNIASEEKFTKAIILVIVYVIIFIIAAIVNYLNTMNLQKAGQKIILSLRRDVFVHIENLSIAQINATPVGKLVTRVTSDVNMINELYTNVIVNLIRYLITIIFVIILMLLISPLLTLYVGIMAPILIILYIIFKNASRKQYRVVRGCVSNVNAFLSENLSGMKITQIFNQEEKKLKEFRQKNNELRKNSIKEVLIFGVFRPAIYVLYVVTQIIVLYNGYKLIGSNKLMLDSYVSFYRYIDSFFNPIQQIADQFNQLQSAFASAERIFEILDIKPQILDDEEAIEIDKFQGKIEFDHVWFSYNNDNWILKDVTFTINPNETVAFVGATGAGKTTILALIVRNYEIQRGEIRIDGINIRKIKIECLRKNIGQMLQDVFLFSGTIRSNLTYGAPDATDEELEEVIKIAQAKEFIDQKEKRLDDPISQGGTNVSGGQKQRLAIARAIAKKPEIFIFDDSFSALDFKTDAKLRNELNKMIEKTRSTVLIVGQRIASIMSANQIIVLDEGKIVGKGTHDELMKNCKVYQEIAYSQLSKEELGHE